MIFPFAHGLTSSRYGDFAKPLSESLWTAARAVATAPVDRPDHLADLVLGLLADETQRTQLGEAARTLYQDRFSIERTVELLLRNEAPRENSSNLATAQD